MRSRPDPWPPTVFEGGIDAARLWTGEPVRDAHLRSADFFDTNNYRKVTLSGRFTERVVDTRTRV